MRKPKALGIALVAMLLISASVAAAAQAQTAFVAGNGTGPAKFKVQQTTSQTFKMPGIGNLECKIFKAEGTGNATTTGVILSSPAYEKCNFFGTNVKVNVGSCNYTIYADGAFALRPAGCKIEFAAEGKCTGTIEGEQKFGAGAFAYTNIHESGKNKELAADASLSGVAYSYSGPSCGSGANTNGTLSGKSTVQATDNSNNPIDLAVENVTVEPMFRAGNGTGTATVKLQQSTPQTLATPAPLPALQCQGLKAEGTTSATEEGVQLSAVENSKCVDINYFHYVADVRFNTCPYYFSASGGLSLGTPGCQIETSDLGRSCSLTVAGEQSFESPSITYTNIQEGANPKEVIAHLEFTEIHYGYSGSNCGWGSGENGTYEGSVRLSAFTEGGTQEDLTVE